METHRDLISDIIQGEADAVQRDLSAGADPNTFRLRTALEWAVIKDRTSVARMLLSAGADPRPPGRFLLARAESVAMTQLLLGEGLNPNWDDDDLTGRTALHTAAVDGKVPVIRCLLGAGAKVNPADASGETPLDLALERGHREAAAVLRRHGAR